MTTVLTLAIGASVSPTIAQFSLGNALDTTNLVWTTGGGASWIGQTNVAHDGVGAAQSGAIFDFQESWLQTTVTGPGTVSFWWRVSSEMDFDYLRFHIDGVLQQQISGEVNWQQRSFPIPQGSHVLRWRYVKDASVFSGQDHGWVDQVLFTNSIGAPLVAVQPVNQTAWEGANAALSVVALGAAPLSHQWFLNDTNRVPNATNATLILSNLLPAGVGRYRVEITNVSGSITSSAATVSLTNNGHVSSVLLFLDTTGVSPFETALNNLGRTYQRFVADIGSFNAAVSSANRATTLVIVDAPFNTYDFSSLITFINGGGRVLMQANSVIPSPPLMAAFNALVDIRGEMPVPVYDWRGSPVFTGLTGPLTLLEIGLAEDIQKYNVLAGGFGVAGFVANATPSEAGIIIGNSGRTILNGFWVEGIYSVPSSVRMAENEILFLTGPVSATTPIIRVQPRSQTAPVGVNLNLQVVAWGGLPLAYQWYRDQTNAITGATAAALAFPSTQLSDTGTYSVVVSNAFGSVTSSPASLVVITNLPVQSILLFVDQGTPLVSPLQVALDNRGLAYQFFNDEIYFNNALNLANPLRTLAVIDATQRFHEFSALPIFVNGGGRALLQYWDPSSAPLLAEAFKFAWSGDILSPLPVYDWGGSSFFSGLSSPLPLMKNFNTPFNTEGAFLQPANGGQAVAGFVSSPSVNQAALVIGNAGRTIVHGFFLEETADFEDAVRLAQNEIDFLAAPLPLSAPRITSEPRNVTMITGGAATLRLNAGGSLPLTYEWRKDGTAIPGATNATLMLSNAQAQTRGGYSVVVSNANGALTSRVASVTVADLGFINRALVFVDAGSPLVSPFATALDNQGVLYDLFTDEAAFETETCFASPVDTMVVINSDWAYHYFQGAKEFVQAGGRSILQYWNLQPASSLASAYDALVAQSLNSVDYVYDWGNSSLFAGLPINPMTMGNLLNINGQSFRAVAGGQALAGYTSTSNASQAAVILGNSGRTFVNGFLPAQISDPVASVRFAQNQIQSLSPRPPVIVTQPRSFAAQIGQPATLRVIASGSQPLSYQWRKGVADIAGAMQSTYSIASVQSNHFGAYSVVVSNPLGVVTSQVAYLDLGAALVVRQAPIDQAVVPGGTATFSVEITGSPPPFNYEWRRINSPTFTNRVTSSERISFFTLTNVQASTGSFRVVIRNIVTSNGVSPPFFNLTLLADADGDGMADAWELAHGLNTNNVADAALDADGDTMSNRAEYIAGTDPINALSYLKIAAVELGGAVRDALLIRFDAVSNKTYTVQYHDAVDSDGWSNVISFVARATNWTASATNAVPPGAERRFYRLVTPRQP